MQMDRRVKFRKPEKTFLELHSKTALQRSPKQLKQMGKNKNIIQVSDGPNIQNWFKKMSLSCGTALVPSSDMVCANAFSLAGTAKISIY